jgi:hypothetical protein
MAAQPPPGSPKREENIMAFIPVPDAVRVTVFGHTGERNWTFSLWFHKASFVEDDMDNLADALYDWCDDALKHALCDDTTIDRLVLYDMNTIDGFKVVKDVDLAGLYDGTPLAVNCCAVMSLYGARRGKWNQGRVFAPGLTEGDVNEYRIDTPSIINYETAFQALVDTPPAGWTWVIASRYFNNAPRAEGVTTEVKTVQVRSNVVGTQKRRLQRP